LPANLDRLLTGLERRMDKLEASEARSPDRPHYSDEQILEIAMITLCYIHRGDVGAYAQYLATEGGMPVREAEELAGTIARLLEERRKTAENPEYPV
jgi:hypothetical protein